MKSMNDWLIQKILEKQRKQPDERPQLELPLDPLEATPPPRPPEVERGVVIIPVLEV
jgi:hypothetical protein